MIPITKSEQA